MERAQREERLFVGHIATSLSLAWLLHNLELIKEQFADLLRAIDLEVKPS